MLFANFGDSYSKPQTSHQHRGDFICHHRTVPFVILTGLLCKKQPQFLSMRSRGGSGGDGGGGGGTDVEGLQEGHPDPPLLFQWSVKIKLSLACGEHTRTHTFAHTQSHDIALSHNLNWLPGAYQLPCSPKALCMFSECLAYAAVT